MLTNSSLYFFLYFKYRAVSTIPAAQALKTERTVLIEKLTYFVTLTVPGMSLIIYFVDSAQLRAVGDGYFICEFFSPAFLYIIVALADTSLSVAYLYLFLRPFEVDLSDDLQAIAKRNRRGCIFAMISTFVALLSLAIFDSSNDPIAAALVGLVPMTDLCVNAICLLYVMMPRIKCKNVVLPSKRPSDGTHYSV